MTLDYLQLLDSDPIYIEGIGHIVPPTIRNIKKIGLNSYREKLALLQIQIKDVLKKDVFESLGEIELSKISIFDLMCSDKKFVKLLIDSLTFFILEDLRFDEEEFSFACYDKSTKTKIGEINHDNFNELCELILQLNFLSTKSHEQLKPKNKRAEKILKKIQSASPKQNEESNLEIGDIVAAICSNVDIYKYSEIWSLTVYQLYDLFFRLKLRKQIDIIAQRWAAWGSEPFDFDLWCKNTRN